MAPNIVEKPLAIEAMAEPAPSSEPSAAAAGAFLAERIGDWGVADSGGCPGALGGLDWSGTGELGWLAGGVDPSVAPCSDDEAWLGVWFSLSIEYEYTWPRRAVTSASKMLVRAVFAVGPRRHSGYTWS